MTYLRGITPMKGRAWPIIVLAIMSNGLFYDIRGQEILDSQGTKEFKAEVFVTFSVAIERTRELPPALVESVSAELLSMIPRNTTMDYTVVAEVRAKPLVEPDLMECDVLIVSSSMEGNFGVEPGGMERRLEYEEHVASGKVRSRLQVDPRGRVRIMQGDTRGEQYGAEEMGHFPNALFPPLPEKGDPFEVGREWQVRAQGSRMGTWIPAGGVCRCEALKVWTTGDVEMVLVAQHEIKDATVDRRWLLRGDPPHVVEYSSHEVRADSNTVSRIDRHAQVISGGIPVRPVDRVPSAKESGGGD